MTWTDRIAVLSQIADLLIKMEIHAFVLIFAGGGLMIKGQHDIGMSLAMTGAGMFGVKKSQG